MQSSETSFPQGSRVKVLADDHPVVARRVPPGTRGVLVETGDKLLLTKVEFFRPVKNRLSGYFWNDVLTLIDGEIARDH